MVVDKDLNIQMRRPWPVIAAAVCAAWLPIACILANNRGEDLAFARLAGWGGLFTVVAVGLCLLARLGDGAGSRRLQATVVAGTLILLMYGPVLGRTIAGRNAIFITAVSVGAVIVAWFLARWPGVQGFFLIVPFFLLLAPAVDFMSAEPARASGDQPELQLELPPVDPGTAPNVWWFLLDGHAREDVMRELGGDFDLAGELRSRGFEVDPSAVSPYEYSHLSIGASLIARYLPDEATYVELADVAAGILGSPPAFAWAAGTGYRLMVLPPANWPGWQCDPPEILCLLASASRVEDALVHDVTIVGPGLALLGSGARNIREVDPLPATEVGLGIQAADPSGRPYFAAIHVMGTHPPYRWLGDDCEPQPLGVPNDGWLPVEDYLDASRCAGQRILEAVDLILAHDPGAVVIVQSDHGIRLKAAEWESVRGSTGIDTVHFGALLATRLPAGCELGIGNNTVNLFRILARCLTGTDVELLPSASWRFPAEEARAVLAHP